MYLQLISAKLDTEILQVNVGRLSDRGNLAADHKVMRVAAVAP